jgi:hypothetical protein
MMRACLGTVLLLVACSAGTGTPDSGSCRAAGQSCTRNDDCNAWNCHCPEDADGGLVLYPQLCKTSGANQVCAGGVEACTGICSGTVMPNQPTDHGCP